jgi:hypothetical protein
MAAQLTLEQISALRIEAEAARRLALCLGDKQALVDLEGYAAELEAQAARLQREQELSSRAQNGRSHHTRLMKPTHAGHG